MKYHAWLSALLILFLSGVTCMAQQGYNIRLKIAGLRDTTAYLGYYINESAFIKDTARVNDNGECAFTGKKPLPHGVYLLVLNKTMQFEFLVGADQDFALSTNVNRPVENMKVTGDRDNTLFFDNISFNIERNREAEPFIKELKDSTRGIDAKNTARDNLSRINTKVITFQEEFIKNNRGTLAARILEAQKPVTIPDAPVKSDGSIDSTFRLRWYREHFFDHFNLADDALLRLSRPLYRDKVYEYLDKLFIQDPDTLFRAVTSVIQRARKNPETYKYAVLLGMLKYQNHEIMGLDKIYVLLYDTYFATGEMDFWVSESTLKAFKQEADRFRKSLIGGTAANLVMQDVSFKPQALYDIKNKYSILYIFDPDCPKCKEETPKLLAFYKQKKFDCEVFAVCSDSSMMKMRNYIKETGSTWITVNAWRSYVGPYQDLYDAMYTPTLYVLDREKKIIGKKIPAEKLDEFLTHYERIGKLKDKS